jgi:hypothetical protein
MAAIVLVLMGCVLVSAAMVSADVIRSQFPTVFGLTPARTRDVTAGRRTS